MPANVETAVYANTPAWHHEGTVLDTKGKEGITVPVALKESGLDWTVKKVPVYAYGLNDTDDEGNPVAGATPIVVDDRFGVQRNTDGKVFGVVGKTWEPVQNQDGFKLIEDFLGVGNAWIEAAGALDGGKKVWILAHMAEDLTIAGEAVSQYVLFTNGHDGRSSVAAAMTNVRVVCQNTLSLALQNTKRIVRVRHTSRATERISAAKHLLGVRDLYAEELAKQGEWLADTDMSDGEFMEFVTKLMPIPEEQEGKPAATMIGQRREEVASVYFDAENLKPIRGTKWGALNAVVEYADYRRPFKDEHSQMKAQWGDSKIKDQALAILTAS